MQTKISNQRVDQESAKINQHLNKQRNNPEKYNKTFQENANRNQQSKNWSAVCKKSINIWTNKETIQNKSQENDTNRKISERAN